MATFRKHLAMASGTVCKTLLSQRLNRQSIHSHATISVYRVVHSTVVKAMSWGNLGGWKYAG